MPYEKVVGLFVMGNLGLVLGMVWARLFPINKNLWTSSYAVFTTGIALIVFAYYYWLIDIKAYRRVATREWSSG
jgi:predicted acyltransferase